MVDLSPDGQLGHCDDHAGHRPELPRFDCNANTLGFDRVRFLSSCHVLAYHLVLPIRGPNTIERLLLRCFHGWRFLWSAGLCDREDGGCWWLERMEVSESCVKV